MKFNNKSLRYLLKLIEYGTKQAFRNVKKGTRRQGTQIMMAREMATRMGVELTTTQLLNRRYAGTAMTVGYKVR